MAHIKRMLILVHSQDKRENLAREWKKLRKGIEFQIILGNARKIKMWKKRERECTFFCMRQDKKRTKRMNVEWFACIRCDIMSGVHLQMVKIYVL